MGDALDQVRKREYARVAGRQRRFDRFAGVVHLADHASQRGAQLVWIVPPRLSPSASQVALEKVYLRALGEHVRPLGAHGLDWRSPDFVTAEDSYDPGHLSAAGAPKLSRALGDYLSTLP